jgi:hypothetical protein
MSKRKNILPQMFDVKPVANDGFLDLEKIRNAKRIITIPAKKYPISRASQSHFQKKSGLRLADVVGSENTSRGPFSPQLRGNIPKKQIRTEEYPFPHDTAARHISFLPSGQASSAEEGEMLDFQSKPELFNKYFETPKETHQAEFKPYQEKPTESEPKKRVRRKRPKKIFFNFRKKRREKGAAAGFFLENATHAPRYGYAFSFAAVLSLFVLIIPAFSFVQKAFDMKTTLTASSEKALGQLAEAKNNLASNQFDKAAVDFSESYEILSEADNSLKKIGGNFSDVLRFVPVISKVASANYVISAGTHFSLAGKQLAESAKSLDSLGNPLDTTNSANQPSLTDLFLNLHSGIENSSKELTEAQADLNKVNIDDLPPEMRQQFADLKEKLPTINEKLKNFLDYSQIFLDVLGYNGPRKYLFLFENNQEMRATGGFIGSYGILDISNGRVKKLFVDDIYNPDGQLKARVIPPSPIQKMSAVWTMHDANWFPDFPTSAEKVAWFYEKTGGPTVDGVIAITPELLKDLLEITGPIDMPEYEKTIDAGNFTEVTQQEVELDYDKELNQPKKFVADLTPKILDKVMSDKGLSQMFATLKAFNSALAEKHLLLYSRNFNVQKLISSQKWSGEILNTDKDYLSVINTNINGFKTDGVIDETIEQHADIQNDGSIIDTVSITRKHNGGNERYDWWNKVNGSWMRIYVPKGAKLLSAEGQTREVVPPALDYNSLGFKKDPQVQSEEDSTRVDDASGTKIYEENSKTVFANWVYVSPGESVTITYKYALPFKLSFDDLHHPADSYSILFQKQSGSMGSKLISEINFPESMKLVWRWPENLKQSGNSYRMEDVLTTDKFVGIAVEK